MKKIYSKIESINGSVITVRATAKDISGTCKHSTVGSAAV